jgi:hypothetical protein
MCEQMAMDGQVKNLGRGQYFAPTQKKMPDNADKLTNKGIDVP